MQVAGERVAWLTGALIGVDCASAGLDVACAPVLDLQVPGAHGVIGDRAYAPDAEATARLGRAMAGGLLSAGVQPVAKHVPGHGRAMVDSHFDLPCVAGVAGPGGRYAAVRAVRGPAMDDDGAHPISWGSIPTGRRRCPPG